MATEVTYPTQNLLRRAGCGLRSESLTVAALLPLPPSFTLLLLHLILKALRVLRAERDNDGTTERRGLDTAILHEAFEDLFGHVDTIIQLLHQLGVDQAVLDHELRTKRLDGNDIGLATEVGEEGVTDFGRRSRPLVLQLLLAPVGCVSLTTGSASAFGAVAVPGVVAVLSVLLGEAAVT